MKKLIKKILKESFDDRIIDVLIKLKLTNTKEIEDFLKEAGYDSKEIDEIYNSYFKTISGMDLTPSNWMNFYFNPDQLDIIDNDVVPVIDMDSIYYSKDGKIVMEYHPPNNGFWFDKSSIWSPIQIIFDLDSHDTRSHLDGWLKNYMGIENSKINPLTSGWY
jgi:hypothetical protein